MNKIPGLVLLVLLCLSAPAAWARTVIPFSGTVDVLKGEASILIGWKEKEGVTLGLTHPSAEDYRLSLNIAHLKAPFGDFAALVEGNFRVQGDVSKKGELLGEIWSRYTLLNYRPVRDLHLKFALRERKLSIDDLVLGSLSGRGTISLEGNMPVNLSLDLFPVDLEETIGLLGLEKKPGAVPLSGIVTGELNLSGPMARPGLQGRVAFYNGRLKSYEYDTIEIDFDGTWPLVRIKDSLITQAAGLSFKFRGALDLSDLSNLGTQFRLFQKIPLVTANRGNREWVFKRLQTGKDQKTEMKYYLMKDDRGDTSAVVGFQKSLEF